MTIPSALLASLSLLLGLALLLPLLPSRHPIARLAVAGLVAVFNIRYISWRYSDTLPLLDLTFNSVLGWAFFCFEWLAVISATLHILLLISPSDRTREADAAEAKLRRAPTVPSVDVFIPTYSESVAILERTLLAATKLDYPRFTVWVLDDGARPAVAALAEKHGAQYLARTERRGFKAGNLNHGFEHSSGDVILCLDADFAVKPSFLWRTVGLLSDPEVAIVQTPQAFINADAVQANLGGADAWPEEQRVFFAMMQPARDTFDNAFCHGTSFVIKRSALNEIGGFPEDSVTEDLYTTYTLKNRGYTTRYLNETLSVGLAADSLPEFIKQRCRWAIGTLQCLRLPNGPIRARRLTLWDRLFFLDPIIFYISYLYIAIALCAPAIYWWTGTTVFHSKLGHLLNMFAPRMGASMVALYWLSGRRVIPFVSEVGRAVGIFQLTRAIWQGLVQPESGVFTVTQKDRVNNEPMVHWPILRWFVLLATLTVLGMVLNMAGIHRPTAWSDDIGMNVALTALVLWTLFLSGLACVEPAEGTFIAGTDQGSVRRSAWALMKRMWLPATPVKAVDAPRPQID